mgnify:CR=1 FL=1
MLRQLKKDGRTIIIITHKLKETLAIADNITILRRGENIASLPAAQATEDKLAELMVGRPISFDVQRVPYDGPAPSSWVLRISALKRRAAPYSLISAWNAGQARYWALQAWRETDRPNSLRWSQGLRIILQARSAADPSRFPPSLPAGCWTMWATFRRSAANAAL